MPIASPTPAQPAVGLTAVPLFQAAWLFAAGIALAGRLWLQPSVVLIALALTAAVCAVAALRGQRIVWLPLAALWLLLGAWCEEMEPHPAPAPALAGLSDGLLRTVEGTVVGTGPLRTEPQETDLDQNVDEPSPASPSERVDLRVESVEVVSDESDAQALVGGGVRLTVRCGSLAAA
jgi:competence protein ComEC